MGLPNNESIKSFSSMCGTLLKTSTWRHFSYTQAFSLHVRDPAEGSGTTHLNHYSHWEQGQRLLCWSSFERVELQLSSCFWWGGKEDWLWGRACLCFRRFMADGNWVELPTSSISSKIHKQAGQTKAPVLAEVTPQSWIPEAPLRKSNLHIQPRWQHLWWRITSSQWQQLLLLSVAFRGDIDRWVPLRARWDRFELALRFGSAAVMMVHEGKCWSSCCLKKEHDGFRAQCCGSDEAGMCSSRRSSVFLKAILFFL